MESTPAKTTEEQRLSPVYHLVALWRACRPWVLRGTWLVILGVAALVCTIKYRAESNLLSVFLAYLPVWVAALPLLVTLMAGMAFACWRSVLGSVIVAALTIVWLGGYRFGTGAFSENGLSGASLSVMTYNRGQGSLSVMLAGAARNLPDIAVFQDAARRLPQLAASSAFLGHPFSSQNGEFVLLSRWPVLENEPLDLTWPENASGVYRSGVRSVVDWNGRRIVVYNIHLPTPRDLLNWYGSRGTFLYGVLGLVPHTPFYSRHQQYLAIWAARVALVTQLTARLRAETEPVLLLGDLNLPPVGEGYHRLCEVLQDAHAAGGKGFGHTFPGNLKSIGRIIAPWIRIDHIFASAHWAISSSQVFSEGSSQHFPVGSVMTLR